MISNKSDGCPATDKMLKDENDVKHSERKSVGPTIDGGWAWVVVLASLLMNMLVGGVIYCGSIFNHHFVEEFDQDKSMTAGISSLQSGLISLLGPLSSALSHRFGIRLTVMTGGVLASLGFVVSSFATSVTFLYFTYGIIGGVGLGLSYTAGQAVLSQYFDKRFILAAGIATSGAGVGTTLFPIVLNELIHHFLWRGTLFIMGGICLNMVVCGALMRPQTKLTTKDTDDDVTKLLDKDVLCNSSFWILALSIFCTGVGLSSAYLHFIASAIKGGASESEASYTLSLIGIGSIVGRLITGCVGHLKYLPVSSLYTIQCLLTGVIISCFPLLVKTFIGRVSYSVLFGLIANGINTLYLPVTAHYVGIQHTLSAFGIQMLLCGLGFFVGPPLTGWVYDLTQSYMNSYYLAGTWMIVSAMVMGCIPFLSMRPKASASKEHDYKFTEHKPSSMVDIEATMM